MSGSKRWCVYRLTWAGSPWEYFGMTSDPKSRLASHNDKPPQNKVMLMLWRQGRRAEMEVVSRHNKRHLCEAAERKIVMENIHREYCVNRFVPHAPRVEMRERKSKWHAPQRGRSFLCSVCRAWQSGEDYHRDSCRFNGLSSRCKSCNRTIQRLLKRGAPWQEARAAAKEAA